MKKTRNQKWVCLILAVIVMISGICLEKVPANALFSCARNSFITRMDDTCKGLEVYRTETFNQREVLSSLRLARKEVRRNQVRAVATLCISSADILPQNFQIKKIAGEDRLYYEILYSLAILTYIHNQDGEKA